MPPGPRPLALIHYLRQGFSDRDTISISEQLQALISPGLGHQDVKTHEKSSVASYLSQSKVLINLIIPIHLVHSCLRFPLSDFRFLSWS